MEKKIQKNNQPQQINIHIEFIPSTGACRVHGPLNLKVLCVIALAEAMKVVSTHTPPIIQPAVLSPNGIPANGNGGGPH